jgi:hypothetical protein
VDPIYSRGEVTVATAVSRAFVAALAGTLQLSNRIKAQSNVRLIEKP